MLGSHLTVVVLPCNHAGDKRPLRIAYRQHPGPPASFGPGKPMEEGFDPEPANRPAQASGMDGEVTAVTSKQVVHTQVIFIGANNQIGCSDPPLRGFAEPADVHSGRI